MVVDVNADPRNQVNQFAQMKAGRSLQREDIEYTTTDLGNKTCQCTLYVRCLGPEEVAFVGDVCSDNKSAMKAAALQFLAHYAAEIEDANIQSKPGKKKKKKQNAAAAAQRNAVNEQFSIPTSAVSLEAYLAAAQASGMMAGPTHAQRAAVNLMGQEQQGVQSTVHNLLNLSQSSHLHLAQQPVQVQPHLATPKFTAPAPDGVATDGAAAAFTDASAVAADGTVAQGDAASDSATTAMYDAAVAAVAAYMEMGGVQQAGEGVVNEAPAIGALPIVPMTDSSGPLPVGLIQGTGPEAPAMEDPVIVDPGMAKRELNEMANKICFKIHQRQMTKEDLRYTIEAVGRGAFQASLEVPFLPAPYCEGTFTGEVKYGKKEAENSVAAVAVQQLREDPVIMALIQVEEPSGPRNPKKRKKGPQPFDPWSGYAGTLNPDGSFQAAQFPTFGHANSAGAVDSAQFEQQQFEQQWMTAAAEAVDSAQQMMAAEGRVAGPLEVASEEMDAGQMAAGQITPGQLAIEGAVESGGSDGKGAAEGGDGAVATSSGDGTAAEQQYM